MLNAAVRRTNLHRALKHYQRAGKVQSQLKGYAATIECTTALSKVCMHSKLFSPPSNPDPPSGLLPEARLSASGILLSRCVKGVRGVYEAWGNS